MSSKHRCTDISAKSTGTLMIVDKKIGMFGRVCQKCSCWKEFSYQWIFCQWWEGELESKWTKKLIFKNATKLLVKKWSSNDKVSWIEERTEIIAVFWRSMERSEKNMKQPSVMTYLFVTSICSQATVRLTHLYLQGMNINLWLYRYSYYVCYIYFTV